MWNKELDFIWLARQQRALASLLSVAHNEEFIYNFLLQTLDKKFKIS